MYRALLIVAVVAGCARDKADRTQARCTLRVSADTILVDGTRHTRDEAVDLCKRTAGAMVTVTDDAPPQTWKELRAALQAVGVTIYMRGKLDP